MSEVSLHRMAVLRALLKLHRGQESKFHDEDDTNVVGKEFQINNILAMKINAQVLYYH
jgi:hypothetical protein